MLVQLVEIPGLIAGAGEDRGGGRALLGVLRGADAIVFCQDASATARPSSRPSWRRCARPASSGPSIVAATKVDEAHGGRRSRGLGRLGLEVVPVSVLDDESLEAFRASRSGGSPA